MSLFLNLYLGHLLGDFLLQPGRLVLAKRDGAPGLLLHTIIVGTATAAVCWATLRVDWSAVVLVAALHLVIERLTIVTYVKTPTRGLFTLLFDQTLHLLSIAVVVWVAGDWALDARAVTFGVRIATPALAAIDAFVAVTMFGSILVFEARNALLRGDAGKGSALRFDLRRFLGIAERRTALGAALLWHPAAGVVAFAPRVLWALTRPRGERAHPLLEAVAGAALCVVAYGAVAVIADLSGTTPAAALAAARPW